MNGLFPRYIKPSRKLLTGAGGWQVWFGSYVKDRNGVIQPRGDLLDLGLPAKPTARQMRKLLKQHKQLYSYAVAGDHTYAIPA